MGNHDELVLYGNKESRVLPPSLTPLLYNHVDDSLHYHGTADERLIFQAVLQVLGYARPWDP